MQFIARSTNKKIACLNSLGDWYDVLSEELIDKTLCHRLPTKPGYYILRPYTCDGVCEVGSRGMKNDGDRCSVYLPIECGKWVVEEIKDMSTFIITYKMLEELLCQVS